jgi:hypothetical protein
VNIIFVGVRVSSSSLVFFLACAAIAQLVERDLAKVEVAGPSPVCRSSILFENTTSQMNLYIRYFDRETLVNNADQAIEFLHTIQDITVTPAMEDDIRSYADSDVYFPKRYKVRAHVYFIIIKTLAKTMLEFKQKKALRQNPQNGTNDKRAAVDNALSKLNENRPGWYEGELDFKRVVMVPSTGKHEYRDTKFVARCKANSGFDCYNRIVEHLRGRVDNRSQFPSAKGKNFHFKYLGLWK